MAYNARPNQTTKYTQGYYQLLNESKYISNPNQIIYRSSLELKFCKFLDESKKVIRWGSEVVSIPYKSFDNKMHTYHIDFYVEVENKNNPNGMDRLLVEVKPHIESMNIINNTPPKKPKKSTPTSLRNWEYALKEFAKNKHKWSHAQEYARIKNYKFVVVTEKTINKFAQL
jgi:hypothetical protein